MGNMNAESAMMANNAQDGMTKLTDAEYTAGVDNGTYTNFVRDAVGYGLCQWTYWTRKQALMNFAKQKGVSIGDEAMQVEFAIQELKTGYPGLWSFLCTTDSVHDAAGRVCTEFERPAVNNIGDRASYGIKFFEETGENAQSQPVPEADTAVQLRLPVLIRGDKGPGVEALQALLIGYGCDLGRTGRDGDFGPLTESALRKYQSQQGLGLTGKADTETWVALLKCNAVGR
jgi:hypothetical protein